MESRFDIQPNERSVLVPQEMALHQCTVVICDLSKYSTIAGSIESWFDPVAVGKLNTQIAAEVASAIRAAGETPESVLYGGTGDGAILVFGSATSAVLFAEALTGHGSNVQSDRHNFRVGVASGVMGLSRDRSGKPIGIAGQVVIRAARLEPKAEVRGILLDAETVGLLDPNVRGKLSAFFDVSTKDRVVSAASWSSDYEVSKAANSVTPKIVGQSPDAVAVWTVELMRELEEIAESQRARLLPSLAAAIGCLKALPTRPSPIECLEAIVVFAAVGGNAAETVRACMDKFRKI